MRGFGALVLGAVAQVLPPFLVVCFTGNPLAVLLAAVFGLFAASGVLAWWVEDRQIIL